jgi:hypothetical protein
MTYPWFLPRNGKRRVAEAASVVKGEIKSRPWDGMPIGHNNDAMLCMNPPASGVEWMLLEFEPIGEMI